MGRLVCLYEGLIPLLISSAGLHFACPCRSPLRLWLLPPLKSVTPALLSQRSRQHTLYPGLSELYMSHDTIINRSAVSSPCAKPCSAYSYKKAQRFSDYRSIQRESEVNGFSMDLLYFSRVLTTQRHNNFQTRNSSKESLEQMVSRWIFPVS